METLQQRLKKSRQDRGLTQAQLAKKAYLSKNTISNIERGITKNLKPDEIKLLSNALMVTEDYLLGISDETNKNKEGLIKPIYILPEWNWEIEIKQVLKKHSRVRMIETILRDCVYFLGQLDVEDPRYYQKTKVTALEKVIELLNMEDFDDIELLNDFLDLLIKRRGIKEEK